MTETPAAPPIDPRDLSASELARLLKVHRGTVTRWVEEDGCPVKAHADRERGEAWSFDLANVVRWRENRAAERARAPLRERIATLEAAVGMVTEGAGVSEDEARRRKRLAEATLLEIELQVKRGELVPGDQTERFLLRLLSAVVQRLRAIPVKAAPLARAAATDAEGEAVLRAVVDEAFTEIADAMRDAGESVERRKRGAT